jgi:hypothetical protein
MDPLELVTNFSKYNIQLPENPLFLRLLSKILQRNEINNGGLITK